MSSAHGAHSRTALPREHAVHDVPGCRPALLQPVGRQRHHGQRVWSVVLCDPPQATRLSRTMLKMVSIIQAANAVFQNPANFGSRAGLLIAGAKVSSKLFSYCFTLRRFHSTQASVLSKPQVSTSHHVHYLTDGSKVSRAGRCSVRTQRGWVQAHRSAKASWLDSRSFYRRL